MNSLDPSAAAPARRSRTLVLSLVAAVAVAAVIAVLAVVWIGGQRPGATAVPVGASIGGEPVELRSFPADEAQMAALTELSPRGYLAMQPFVIADDDLRAGGVRFDLELPTTLPDAAFATFAYLDLTIGEWVPVATRVDVDQRTVVAEPPASDLPAAAGDDRVITTASLRSRVVDTRMPFDPATQIWTVVIGGIGDAVDTVGDAIGEAGAAIVEIADAAGEQWEKAVADWSADFTLGSQWLMRVQRDVLGTGADTPECSPDADGAVPWVSETLTSDNAMIAGLGVEGGNAAVLICVGPDPADPSLLQVRAAANRSYGFPVVLADGLVTTSAGMDVPDSSAAELIGTAYSLVASSADLLLNPGAFILPGQSFSLTVDEAAVRASHELTGGNQIVAYPLPAFPQVLLSGFLGAAMEELDPDDLFAGSMSVFFLMRDCDVATWAVGAPWTELIGSVSTCLEVLDSDTLQNTASEFARSASGESADAAAAFVSGGAEKARTVIGKLKWLALFSAAQTVSDHIADVGVEELTDRPAWYVNVITTEAPAVRWEGIAGTWCGLSAPCIELVPGTTQNEWGTSTLSFDRMMGECFGGSETSDPGSGAMVVYCPAGAATPAEIPGSDVGLPPGDDNPAFDRVFIYQGYGTIAWFRQSDLEAVKGS